jgi:hypothetical protein
VDLVGHESVCLTMRKVGGVGVWRLNETADLTLVLVDSELAIGDAEVWRALAASS